MVKAQNGDGVAYDVLLYRLYTFLRGYLRVKLNQNEEVENLIQEVLMAMHKSRHTYDSEKPFMSWFLAITHYKHIDFLRKRKELLTHISPESIQSEDQSPIDHLILKERKEVLLKSIDSLDDRSKKIVTLLKIENKKIPEIAAELNLSESNVKVIAHRAYETLRLEIEKKNV